MNYSQLSKLKCLFKINNLFLKNGYKFLVNGYIGSYLNCCLMINVIIKQIY